MNIVIYAEKGSIQFSIDNKRIKIMVKDQGPGIEDIDLAMQEGYSTAEPWVRELGFGAGMGLPNIKKCSDKFDIQSTVGIGTRLMIEILIDGAS
jgi:anti-sigma regulatory factor (Ser/Thr protein kinase)